MFGGIRRTWQLLSLSPLVFLPLTVGIALGGGQVHAAVGDVAISSPGTNPDPNSTFTSSVTADVGASALGAYSFEVTYNPNVVVITGIAGGSAPGFSSAPTTNPATFSSGLTPFNAFQFSSLVTPAGVVEVAVITFKAVGYGGTSSSLQINVKKLVDTNGAPIMPNPIAGNVLLSGGSGGELTILTDSLPNAIEGEPYSVGVLATGGTIPYSWSIVSGELPTALVLDPDTGRISGTPDVTGRCTFTVQVTDSAEPQASDTKSIQMRVVRVGAFVPAMLYVSLCTLAVVMLALYMRAVRRHAPRERS